MREILFRGKRKLNGKWLQGFIFQNFGQTQWFIRTKEEIYPINPETIGQYTGLTDKNGKKIFEGDIVKAQDFISWSPFCDGMTGKIIYEDTAFFIEPKKKENAVRVYDECAIYEVIGNIYDNPELLESEV